MTGSEQHTAQVRSYCDDGDDGDDGDDSDDEDDDDDDEDDDWASGGQQFISTVVFESIARKTKSQVGCLQASHHTERCMYVALWSPACTY